MYSYSSLCCFVIVYSIISSLLRFVIQVGIYKNLPVSIAFICNTMYQIAAKKDSKSHVGSIKVATTLNTFLCVQIVTITTSDHYY